MKDAFLTLLIVSVAYIVTFSLTFGFVFPLQQLLLSGISTQVGLLFLPHGVRVLTLYFYGWRGMFYLLPVELPDDFIICRANGTRFVGANS